MGFIRLGSSAMERLMTQEEHDAAVVAFIRARGVTRCPTACVVPTQASVAEPDRLALRRRDDHLEEIREERLRHAASRGFGIAATLAARSPVH
jgi:hypothetical protein